MSFGSNLIRTELTLKHVVADQEVTCKELRPVNYSHRVVVSVLVRSVRTLEESSMRSPRKSAISLISAALLSLQAAPLFAQLPEHLRDFPLATRGASGESVAPFFNGWIRNYDDSVTLIFGFANQNREEVTDIPIGPNNRLEPNEYDGGQPTHFPVYQRRGFVGIQERGAFAVVLPAEEAETEVTWTLTSGGQTWTVPGRTTSSAYEMSNGERAQGSLKPAIRFSLDGAESTSVQGIYATPMSTTVGEPVTLSAYVQDRGNRGAYPENKIMLYQVGTEWLLHQGPEGAVLEFSNPVITGRDRAREAGESASGDWTEVTTQATFSEPGDYVIRLRVDNFLAADSKFDNVCCWSNAYVPVTVAR